MITVLIIIVISSSATTVFAVSNLWTISNSGLTQPRSFTLVDSSGTICTNNGTCTLSNKGVSGLSNTITNVPNSALDVTMSRTNATETNTAKKIFSAGAGILGLAVGGVSKTNDYTASSINDLILVDATSRIVTITMPSASVNVGKIYTVVKTDNSLNKVIMKGGGTDTIGGNATKGIFNQYDAYTIFSDGGTDWKIKSHPSDAYSSFWVRGTTANRWYSNAWAQQSFSSGAMTANSLRAYPIVFAKTMTIDQIGMNVTGSPAGGCHVGIYSQNGTSYPANLVSGSDVTLDTSTVGAKLVAFGSPITLFEDNLYFLTYLCQNAITASITNVATSPNILGMSSTLLQNTQATGFSTGQTYGALPSTYGSSGIYLSNNSPPLIVFRISG